MNEVKSFRSCKDCKDRHIGCHSTCEAYQNEKQIFENFRDREHQRKKIENDLRNDYYRRIRKK